MIYKKIKLNLKNNIKFYLILLALFFFNYFFFDNFCFNEGQNLELIKELIERYFDPKNIYVPTESERKIAEYWKPFIPVEVKDVCPFSKMCTRGFTKSEAQMLLDFFNFNGCEIEDLEKKMKFFLEEFESLKTKDKDKYNKWFYKLLFYLGMIK